jgi:hypothetical protein
VILKQTPRDVKLKMIIDQQFYRVRRKFSFMAKERINNSKTHTDFRIRQKTTKMVKQVKLWENTITRIS